MKRQERHTTGVILFLSLLRVVTIGELFGSLCGQEVSFIGHIGSVIDGGTKRANLSSAPIRHWSGPL